MHLGAPLPLSVVTSLDSGLNPARQTTRVCYSFITAHLQAVLKHQN